jgi:hypothetical protein
MLLDLTHVYRCMWGYTVFMVDTGLYATTGFQIIDYTT